MAIKNWLSIACLLGLFTISGQNFYLGADLSYVNELEDCGTTYKDDEGSESDPYALFQSKGSNLVRLRLWHNPDWTNYSNLEDVKASIARAKSAGMEVLLDFHYSDFWADPGRQWRPQAWEDVTTDQILGDSLFNYTYQTLIELNSKGLLPEMVQIGNETNGNILIKRDDRSISGESPNLYPIDWARQAMLFNKGLEAVKDVETELQKDVKTLIHIADPLSATSWFQDAQSNGLDDFDMIGLSYYPQWHDLGVREVGAFVKQLKEQFSKEVMIVETGYPWTSNGEDQANNVLNFNSRLFTYSNNFSVEVQRDFMIELSWIVKENGGLGVIYWEPAWVSSSCQTYWGTGSHWENAALFDFEGQINEAADFLSYDYDQMPTALGDQQINFKVDMTGISTENGVFVTGEFTGENWQLIPMTNTSDHFYEYSTTIPGRSAGAYIFYNNDVWSNTYRETVPDNCARISETHREYWVKGGPAEFYFSWGKCDQVPNPLPLSVNERSTFSFYPTLVEDQITFTGSDFSQLEIINLQGVKQSFYQVEKNTLDVSDLAPGLYLIKKTSNGTKHSSRFIKK